MNIDRISTGLYVILVGFVFLWITLGFTKWNIIFQFFRLWPLIFVVIGIEVIFERTKLFFFRVLSPLVVAASVIWIIYISQSGNLFHPRNIEPLKLREDIPMENEYVNLGLALSSGKISVSESGENNINAKFAAPKNSAPHINFRNVKKETFLEVFENPQSSYVFSPWDSENLWDIKVTKDASLEVKARTDLNVNKFNFSNLNLKEFIIDTKLSSNEIILGDSAAKVEINATASKITMIVPKGAGIKINLNKFLIIDNFDELGLEKGFKEYTSPNYEKVGNRIDLNLNLKFSQFEIKFR